MDFKHYLALCETQDIKGQLQQYLPSWPEYVIDDMLMGGFKNPNSGWKTAEDAIKWLEEVFPQIYGRQATQAKWQLMAIPVKLDAFDQTTLHDEDLINRVQGAQHQGPPNKNDADRTAFAANRLQTLQQQGQDSYDEPIIVAKVGNKYKLIEGWHRVIELLKNFPQGTQQQAWVMV